MKLLAVLGLAGVMATATAAPAAAPTYESDRTELRIRSLTLVDRGLSYPVLEIRMRYVCPFRHNNPIEERFLELTLEQGAETWAITGGESMAPVCNGLWQSMTLATGAAFERRFPVWLNIYIRALRSDGTRGSVDGDQFYFVIRRDGEVRWPVTPPWL